jgi:murein DD-endopeptidase MepM/ murein hydrolase activator NlpD
LFFFLASVAYAFPPSITGGEPKGDFGDGGQTNDVTEPGNWRWSEWFYGHRGIDRIDWQYDACGGWHNYAVGWHGGDLIEYLMKFGGRYSRLNLLGIADHPGPVELNIYVDGQYEATTFWDDNNDCNQSVTVDIAGIPYGTHAIAVQFTKDYYSPPEDRNFSLDALLVVESLGIPSLTGGEPKVEFGAGGQSDEVTEPGNWRWSEWFYGHRGIDGIAWDYDACGEYHNYAVGLHGTDLIEYLMEFGGNYSRLNLLGIADRPGPVELAVYIDGEYKATAFWNNDNDCNQLVAVDIPGILYGTHAIAVQFVNDYYNPPEDRNLYLDALLVTESEMTAGGWAYPVGDADSGSGWYVTNPLGNSWYSQQNQRWYRGHLGEDWFKRSGGSLGEPVYAAAAGRVITVLNNCGNYVDVVIIEHQVAGFDEPIYSFYGHLEANDYVQEGDWVEKRQQIAVIGDPRPDFGPHLHFEIKNHTALINPPLSGCSDVKNGVYISAGYSGMSDDYDGGDYYDPSDSIPGNRYFHPNRFIENHKGEGPLPNTIIVDDGDAGFLLFGPSEYWHPESIGYGGDMYWTYVNGNVVSNKVHWQPQLSGPGQYEVKAFIPHDHGTTRSARYTVRANGGTYTATVDQYNYYDAWVSLGIYYFNSTNDGTEYVELTDATGEAGSTQRKIGFDAVNWEKE